MIGIDYETFMIMSCIGSHYIKHNTKEGSNWDSLWEQTRSKKIDKLYTEKKLTIFALANIMRLPKETVRRKIGILIKKKLINHSRKDGLLPTDKVEDVIKPFAIKELNELSNFLKALKKHNTLDQLLEFKE
jgi:predicted transcriptional regulator